MALTASRTLEIGTHAPYFDLPTANPQADDIDGDTRSLGDYEAARVVVVVFTCNHCPYAVHVEDELIRISNDYAARGVQIVAISSNDAAQYPQDGFEAMQQRARAKGYPFPYLYDASQDVAKAYGAVCTPDVYVYDRDFRLVYHGRVDETRPRQQPAHGGDLRRALDELLGTGEVSMDQTPSMGCNIKWKSGNQPAYYFG